MKLLVTGGCGFIGSAFVRLALGRGAEVVNLDKLTYAGNPANVADVADDEGYRFVHADIADAEAVDGARSQGVDAVVNFAAESHVDRSILDPTDFIHTDVVGTAVLLEAARRAGVGRFVQVSTDEVYGSIPTGAFRETDPISPSQPLLGQQGRRRPAGARLAPHLRPRRRRSPAARTPSARASTPRS